MASGFKLEADSRLTTQLWRCFRYLWPIGLLSGCHPATSPKTGGATGPAAPVVEVWGRRGHGAGEFIQPRAVAISRDGFAFVADYSGRVQKWTTGGKFVMSWRMPSIDKGRPEGVAILKDGNIAVTDTHYSQIRIYSPLGKLLLSFGKYGAQTGGFLLVTGICVDSDGYIYASDYGGDDDRVSKWTPRGELLASWTGHGEGPRQFRRPCGLAISKEGDLLVADIANHRIQRLDRRTGQYKGVMGSHGRGDGQLSYPYGVAVDPQGFIYTVEYNTHRVQKWTSAGKWVATWGSPGRAPGQLANPWGLTVDAVGNVYVADTGNNRVQKFRFP